MSHENTPHLDAESVQAEEESVLTADRILSNGPEDHDLFLGIKRDADAETASVAYKKLKEELNWINRPTTKCVVDAADRGSISTLRVSQLRLFRHLWSVSCFWGERHRPRAVASRLRGI